MPRQTGVMPWVVAQRIPRHPPRRNAFDMSAGWRTATRLARRCCAKIMWIAPAAVGFETFFDVRLAQRFLLRLNQVRVCPSPKQGGHQRNRRD